MADEDSAVFSDKARLAQATVDAGLADRRLANENTGVEELTMETEAAVSSHKGGLAALEVVDILASDVAFG